MRDHAPVIDVHTHLAPVLAADADRTGPAALYDADGLVRRLARTGLDRAWVSAPPPFYRQGMDIAETREWVRRLDAGMRARLAGRPGLDRLTYLPFDQPSVATELVRDTRDNVGWTGAAGGLSVPLDAPDAAALWEAVAASRRPLVLHPGTTPDARLGRHYLANLLGNPVETGVAAAELVLGGVLQRHPDLRIVLVHCGGIVPSVVGRWSRGVATERPGIARGLADPRTTVRRFWADSVCHRPEELDLAVATFGADKIVLGSDYPFPMGAEPDGALAHLPRDLRDRIARNAAGLVDSTDMERQEIS